MRDFLRSIAPQKTRLCAAAVACFACFALAPHAAAAELPEERSDVMYHVYDGGGQTVQGPALLLRRNFAETVSLSASYYVDEISGASIDVITNASPYTERRTEGSVGTDYLHRDTLMGVTYTRSSENDYDANTWDFAIAQDLFGGLTTLNAGFNYGRDTVGRVDTDFEDDVRRFGYRVGLTQVLTPRLIATLDYEAVADEGYLQNPYRSARVLGAAVPEAYPRTRTSNAVAVSALRYFEGGWSGRLEYRYFTDTWGITAHTFGVGWSRYVRENWILDARYRYYTQGAADFYADDFERPLRYMARDKELSRFDSHSLGVRLSMQLFEGREAFLRRGALSVSYEHILFDYRNFTDIRTGDSYGFGADVMQVYFTAWY